MVVKISDSMISSVSNHSLNTSPLGFEESSPANTYLSDNVVDSVLDELGEAHYGKTHTVRAVTRTKNPVPGTSQSGGLAQLLGQLDQVSNLRFKPSKAPQPVATPTEPLPSRFLIFNVQDWNLAVPLDHVMEVGSVPSTTWVPQLPLWVRGITHIRGEIYTVVDLRAIFNLDRSTRASEQMILTRSRVDDMRTVLVVDKVLGIRSLPVPKEREAIPPLSPDLDPFVQGISNWQDRPLIFFDLNQFLNSSKLHPWRDESLASSF